MKAPFSLIALALLGAGASAQTLISADFEAPTFTAGNSLVGQDGWIAGSGSDASQTVTNTQAASGTQSLLWDNSLVANNSFYSVRKAFTPVAGATHTLTGKVYIDSSSGADRLYGIYLSTSTLPGTYLGATIGGDGGIRMGKTWAATYASTPNFAAPAGSFFDRWLTFQYDIDAAGNAVVNVSGFGGGASYSQTFTGVTLAASSFLNLGTDYNTTTARLGKGYFDDIRLTAANPVPEPASLAVLGLGALGLLRRRRRS